MRLFGSTLELSPTDLANFLGCRHRTALDMAVAHGKHRAPPKTPDPLLEVLWQRGLDHEKRYVDSLKAEGRDVLDLSAHKNDTREVQAQKTLDAMKGGAGVIVQGALRDDRWFGYPDVLFRTDTASELGDWSYEVVDTKLSRETKAGTILQLGLYSEMLARVQKTRPEYFRVVTPDPITPRHDFRLDDYSAYFRMVRSQMLGTVELDHDEVAKTYYPEPVTHCAICRWDQQCDSRRRADDHLSLVAFMPRMHRRELESRGITTLEALATYDIPPDFKPVRGSVETYVKMREQARVQFESRATKVPVFEVRDVVMVEDETGAKLPAQEGLCRLPEPSPGDIFLDLEGAPFAAEGGREYLFGVVTVGKNGNPSFRDFWAFTEKEERVAFEQVMDLIMAAWEKHPGMHVYHYAAYEPVAFKKLVGRHVTRGTQLDRLLKAGKFVDLYAVVRQGLRVGTESYSIKALEPVYGFEREVDLRHAGNCRNALELALDLSAPGTVTKEVKESVRGYNEDDCVSTLRLRDWLEGVRASAIKGGKDIPRPAPPKEEEEKLDERAKKVADLRAVLLKDVSEERVERSDEEQARWALAHMLDYHRREANASYWEYYRLREMPEEDLDDEPQAITNLSFVKRVDVKIGKRGPTGTVTDRYTYPPQEMEIERGDLNLREGGRFGKVVAVDRAAHTIDVEKGAKQAENHPKSVFAYTFIAAKAQEESLFRIAERVANDGRVVAGRDASDRAARALLLALPPQLAKGKFTGLTEGDDALKFLTETVVQLDRGVLPVQGPPGAGKTYSGAAMIATLVAKGKKVGIAATSHKVIRNLLDAICDPDGEGYRILKAARITVKLGHKCDDDDPSSEDGSLVIFGGPTGNASAKDAIESGAVHVLGGTAWLWSREDMAGTVDVLFVDEAGQMALANVIAMSPAAASIVLLGDPQQLDQPTKASHPDGVDVSALGHLMGGHNAIPADKGVLLPTTWRMCPAITTFTSELFYENRLSSVSGLERQKLAGTGDFDGSGLWVVKAEHDGNHTSSIEEIELVAQLVERLTAKGATWTDKAAKKAQLRGDDILIVAPYNAQVSRLTERLEGTGARVGTVDKFQGQEAPVVIYSMATSRPEDAPRGMEFLYSVNRLNVATSRARCAAIVVASERLFDPECRTPRQMKLANALCRYREMGATP